MLTTGGASRERELTNRNSTLKSSLGATAFTLHSLSEPDRAMLVGFRGNEPDKGIRN